MPGGAFRAGRYFLSGAGAGAGWAGVPPFDSGFAPLGGGGRGIVTGFPPLSGTTVIPGCPEGRPVPGPAGMAGCAGAFFVIGALSRTEEPTAELPRVARIASVSDVTMNSPAATVVARDSSVAPPRGPKAVCEPIPPNAPARSAAFPLCRSTTITKKTQMMTWIIVSKITISSTQDRRTVKEREFP